MAGASSRAQLHHRHGNLQDLGSKGSGTTTGAAVATAATPSRGVGVREVIASEVLHHLGVTTSRTLSPIETGENLWRGDEPTRSSVMVPMARTHLRFGTCKRLPHCAGPGSWSGSGTRWWPCTNRI